MKTLAGQKIRSFRTERALSRSEFGKWVSAPGSTVQGWEEDGKRANPEVINQLAAIGVAGHADWTTPARLENSMAAPLDP